MAVITKVIRRYTVAEVQFFYLLCATWFCFYLLADCYGRRAWWTFDVIAAMVAAAVSFFILRVMGYFTPLRIMPRRSDILLALVAVPAGGLVMHGALRVLVGGVQPCDLRMIVQWTPVLAVVIFGSHYFLSLLLIKFGRRKKVVLDLTPQERAHFTMLLAEGGIDSSLEYLTPGDMKKHLLMASNDISLIVISSRTVQKFDADGLLIRAHLNGIPIIDYRNAISIMTGRIPLEESDLWGFVMGAIRQTRPYLGV